MADVNAKVMKMVEDEIGKNPNVTTAELYEKAKKIDKGMEKLSARQFNARYPLQVKRKMAPPRRRTGSRRRRSGPNKEAIRTSLLQFAQALVGAENKGQVVDVIANIDTYVDKVATAASSR